ncbi:TetR/AcrR family transcriptional regulator [Streptomyces sp. CB01881]|uniref:TetR/AcrR family transcriptional regulator n=1 Tax=Streptomyces sp. CB01881 TaxID=2078691 RepID=UPI000CDC80EC|nr:TetR/AcrR family transcriptional regulator [Streptomyces sp. CB01881]AUY53399.1 TetR family transcriptional regulator [Streptomyces sp. CB01881]TYC69552.1 TetR family transcriptional regulator [Streptomyces sp. CB01881]
MTDGTPNLRELNKRRTREAISHAATRLFIERGFDRTTIAEVAAAAGVAKMTVTNHFPRKEDLVLDLHEEIVAGLARTVAGRAPGESALAALRRECLAAIDRHDAALGFSGPAFARTITESPALVARLREIHEQSEDALGGALAEATDSPPADLTARLAAGLLAAIHRTLFAEVFRRTLAGEEHESTADAIRPAAVRAFEQLEGALGGYAVRPVA